MLPLNEQSLSAPAEADFKQPGCPTARFTLKPDYPESLAFPARLSAMPSTDSHRKVILILFQAKVLPSIRLMSMM